jgi:phosphinothricin acetyltransferase
MTVRDATAADLPRIVEIYNAAIPSRRATADLFPVTVEARREWFARHDPASRPLWVALVDGEIVAWIGLSSFYHDRPAYQATAEASMYIAPGHQGQGLGRDLLQRMIDACPRLGITTLLGMYFDHNDASHRLCAGLGFEQCGHLTEIAELDGVKRGLVIVARRIEATHADPVGS